MGELAPILVADLDGTLLRSDMLYETFWARMAESWLTPVNALLALRGGPAGLKRYLATDAPVQVELLPYDPEVIAYLERWRAAGGQTALVTASDQLMADRVAAHVGLFDQVHGSDGQRNLKGPNKAAFLVDRFGAEGFDYIGDSPADLKVWAKARRAITINLSSEMRAKTETQAAARTPTAQEVVHLVSRPGGLGRYGPALGLGQWAAVLPVFLPWLWGGASLGTSLGAALALGGLSTAATLTGAMLRLAEDRQDPARRARPFASGLVPLSHGMILTGLFLTIAALLGGAVGWSAGPGALLAMASFGILALLWQIRPEAPVGRALQAGLYGLAFLTGLALPG